MINSAAFPNVAFNKPPIPCPTFSDKCSVARPISPASGMMASPAHKKSKVSFRSAGTYRNAKATGTKHKNQSNENLIRLRIVHRQV
jgi:hypothetical protein